MQRQTVSVAFFSFSITFCFGYGQDVEGEEEVCFSIDSDIAACWYSISIILSVVLTHPPMSLFLIGDSLQNMKTLDL